MKFRRTGPIIAWALLVMLIPGCLFEPRVAEAPGGGNIIYLDQSGAKNVRANLETAFNNKDTSGYDRQIAADFRYEPDSGTLASYPDVDWEAWDREQEIAFIGHFFNNVDAILANLDAVTVNENLGDVSAELRYIYSINVTESGGVVPYRAQVTFEFRLDGTYWKLFRWFDEQGEQDPDTGSQLPTIGQRRGAFAVSGGG